MFDETNTSDREDQMYHKESRSELFFEGKVEVRLKCASKFREKDYKALFKLDRVISSDLSFSFSSFFLFFLSYAKIIRIF